MSSHAGPVAVQALTKNEGLPSPAVEQSGWRSYQLSDIYALRRYLASFNTNKARRYFKWRDAARGEHLQVLAVTNFKGGSGKTTTAAHLAQYLALQGIPGAGN
jgi:chromosome partitioning protein